MPKSIIGLSRDFKCYLEFAFTTLGAAAVVINLAREAKAAGGPWSEQHAHNLGEDGL
jgi:hypothetical protein